MLTRLKAMLVALNWKRYARAVLWFVVVSFAFWFSDKVFRSMTGKGFWDFLLSQMDRPIGSWLFLLILWVALCFGFMVYRAWRETRPKPAVVPDRVVKKPEEPKPPPLTRDEQDLVHFARLFWKDGSDTVHRTVRLIHAIQLHLASEVRFVLLLYVPLGEMTNTRDQLFEVFESKQVPPETVMRGLRRLGEQYIEMVRWINYCRETHGVDLASPPYAEDHADWPTHHRQFMLDMESLALRPGYESLKHFVHRDMQLHKERFPKMGEST